MFTGVSGGPEKPCAMETDPCPPSPIHWHDWYEGNCAFCSIPGHMRRIKFSSSQNLLLVNELLIQASSSPSPHPLTLAPPFCYRLEGYLSDPDTIVYTHTHTPQLSLTVSPRLRRQPSAHFHTFSFAYPGSVSEHAHAEEPSEKVT